MSSFTLFAARLIDQIRGDDATQYFERTTEKVQEKILYKLIFLGKFLKMLRFHKFSLYSLRKKT